MIELKNPTQSIDKVSLLVFVAGVEVQSSSQRISWTSEAARPSILSSTA